jgi:hypothetical protein
MRLVRSGRHESAQVTGEPAGPDADTDGPTEFQQAWANRREAELRSRREPEWRHNEEVLGDFTDETVEERIARQVRETLWESFEAVPGLRALYSADPETGVELLDPEKCRALGESGMHRMLRRLVSARLDGAPDREMACQGSKAGIGLQLSVEQLPVRRLCLAYARPEHERRDGIDIVAKRALVFDPETERFVCQEISRPWTEDGSSRSKVADGTVTDDLTRTESPSGLLDVVSAVSLLAEAKAVKQPAI